MSSLRLKLSARACALVMAPAFMVLSGLNSAALAQGDSFAPVGSTSWEGFFVGAMFTGGQTTAEGDLEAGNAKEYSDIAGGIGIYGGFNMDMNSMVLGFEGDLTKIMGHEGEENASNLKVSKLHVGSARAKLGLPVMGTGLAYGTVGVAFGSGEVEDTDAAAKVDASHLGWTLGLGADVALIDNIMARVEYRYTSLSDETYSIDGRDISVGFDSHDINIGLAYKF